MKNPLIDQRHFEKRPWKQETIWVQRNARGVIVGLSEKPPQNGNMIPTLPPKTKGAKVSNEHHHQPSAAAQL